MRLDNQQHIADPANKEHIQSNIQEMKYPKHKTNHPDQKKNAKPELCVQRNGQKTNKNRWWKYSKMIQLKSCVSRFISRVPTCETKWDFILDAEQRVVRVGKKSSEMRWALGIYWRMLACYAYRNAGNHFVCVYFLRSKWAVKYQMVYAELTHTWRDR